MNKEKLLILGLGKSGIAAATLAYSKGYDVFAFDDKKNSDYQKSDLERLKLDKVCFTSNLDIFNNEYNLIVVSPGIDLNEERFKILKGKKIISEIEFAWNFLKGQAITVTGSNGKSTTVALITHILNENNIKAISCGNFGLPLSTVVFDKSKDDFIKVVELSSFQLENTNNIEPVVSICLDITENHLNRYDSFNSYENAKLRLFYNNSKNSNWIISKKVTDKNLNLKKYDKLTEVDGLIAKGKFNANISDRIYYNNVVMDINNEDLKTECNKSNLLYVLFALSFFLKLDKNIENQIASYKSLHYRQEKIYEDKNLKIINDSKSSSPDAVVKALLNNKGNDLILIIGGRNKRASFMTSINEFLSDKITIIAYGESRNFFKELFLKQDKDIYIEEYLKNAVDVAFNIIHGKKIILFSPGCESFDQFLSYSQRGEYFSQLIKEKVKQIKGDL